MKFFMKYNKFLALLGIVTFTVAGLVAMTSKPTLQDVSEMTDGRDGTIYKTVKIGGQTWLGENLIFEIEGSYWYNNKKGSGKGKLYTWEAAKKACPNSWHLPTDEDWQQLEVSLGMDAAQAKDIGFRGTDQGKQLKPKGKSGMSLQLGGFRHTEGSFGGLNENGYYWTATPHMAEGTALRRSLNSGSDQVYRTNHDAKYSYSCRCVKD
jgi:uncharacterized protein (TIGR02145 family)